MAIATTEPSGATRYCRVIVRASASVTSSRRSRRPFAQYRHRAFHAMAMNRKLPEYTTAAVPASGGRHVSRHNGGREGRQDDEEEDPVPQHQAAINPVDVAEHVVVVEPHDEDGDEARHQGKEGLPLVDQALGQRYAGRGWVAEI